MFSSLYFYKGSLTGVVHKFTVVHPHFSPVNYYISFKTIESQTESLILGPHKKKSQQDESTHYFNLKKKKNHSSTATCPKLNCLKPSSNSAPEDQVWRKRDSIKLYLEPFLTKTRGCGKYLATVPINLASKDTLSGLTFHLKRDISFPWESINVCMSYTSLNISLKQVALKVLRKTKNSAFDIFLHPKT